MVLTYLAFGNAMPPAPGGWGDTSPQNGCCRATFGCYMGTCWKHKRAAA